AMPREQKNIPQLARHSILIALASEKAPQSFLGHIRFDRPGIAALAADRQRRVIQVGSENLNFSPDVVTNGFFQKENSDRIGFLAGGATRYPDANGISRLVVEEFWNDQSRQFLERVRIAEERRHRDEEIGEKGLRLGGTIAQDREIFRHC